MTNTTECLTAAGMPSHGHNAGYALNALGVAIGCVGSISINIVCSARSHSQACLHAPALPAAPTSRRLHVNFTRSFATSRQLHSNFTRADLSYSTS